MKPFYSFLTCCCFVLSLFATQSATAQCDCPFEGDPICVSDSTGVVFAVPNQCWADCLGLIPSTEECDLSIFDDPTGGNDPWDNDCECDGEFDEEGICVSVELDGESYTEWVPDTCFLACIGITEYEIVECEDYDDPWQDDCDCEESDPEEFVCILTDAETGVICPFPSLCLAECAGYDSTQVVDCGDLPGFECLECGEEEYSPVCVVDSTGYVFEVPNACFAECLGLELSDEDCSWDDPCACEGEFNEEGICVSVELDGESYTEWVPDTCFLACIGITEYEIVDCDSLWVDPWDDCNCTADYDPVCVIDSSGVIFEVSNACWAECYGLEITEEDCGWVDPWEDCDCSDEPANDGEGICIEITYEGEVYSDWAINECWADCFFDDYTIVECDNGTGGDDTWTEIDSCLLTADLEGLTLLQEFITVLADCGVPFSECVLNAPTFDNDEDFIAYLEDNCDEIIIGDAGSQADLMERMSSMLAASPTSVADVFTSDVSISFQSNPATNFLQYNITTDRDMNAIVSISDAFGKLITTEQVQLVSGDNNKSQSLEAFGPNIYFLTVQQGNAVKTEKFIVIK